MNQANENFKPSGSLSPDDLLAAVRRHQEVMEPADWSETSLVARAVEAYWAGARQRSGLEPVADLELETAASLRSVAAGLAFGQNEAPPRSGFWRDLAFATLPVTAALLTLAVPAQLGILPPAALPVVGVAVSAMVALFLLLRSRQLDRHEVGAFSMLWPRWRGSLGALAGGMIVAAGVGVSSYEQTLRAMSMKLSLAENRMADFAVASLAAVRRGGTFLPAPEKGRTSLAGLRWHLFSEPPTFSFAAETATAAGALYRGNASGVPGELVLKLEPGQGQLEWRKKGKSEVRDRFVVGKLGKRRPGGVEVVAESGTRLWLELGGQAPLTLAEGSCLVACFSAETNELKAFQPVAC